VALVGRGLGTDLRRGGADYCAVGGVNPGLAARGQHTLAGLLAGTRGQRTLVGLLADTRGQHTLTGLLADT